MRSVFFVDNLIVTCSEMTICVWSNTGRMERQYRHQNSIHGKIDSLVMWGDKVLFSSRETCQIHSFDVRTGALRMNLFSVDFSDRTVKLFELLVCGGKWLLVHYYESPREFSDDGFSGIYVIDLDESEGEQILSWHSFFEGGRATSKLPPGYILHHSNDNLVVSPDCSKTSVFAKRSEDRRVDVLELNDGRLSYRFSFPAAVSSWGFMVPSQSRVFSSPRSYTEPHPDIVVYNTGNGERERTLNAPPGGGAVLGLAAKTKQELFVGMNTAGDFLGDNGPTVASYCLTEAYD